MAVIDSKKLLPPSKSSGSALATQKFLVPISNIKVKSSAIIRASDIKPVENSEDGGGGKILVSEVLQIRENIASIQRVIVSNTTLLQQSEERKRKLLEKEKFSKKEQQLEKKDPKQKTSLSIPSLPRTGFFDAIKRFLFYTLLGSAFVKFGKYIPKILEFSKKLMPAFKFVEDFAGNVLNGAVEFIDKGYKAYDKVREISKTIGGEDLQKKFDEFSKQFNTFANLAIIAGMATMGGTDFSGKGTKPGRPSTLTNNSKLSGYFGRDPQTKLIERRYGNDAARMYEARKAQGASVNRARADVVKRFETLENKFGPQRGLGGGTGKGSLFSRGLGRSFNRASLNVLGKTGTRVVKGVFGKIPIIGGLVDFIISTVIFKEKPGRAAAKAVGSTIGAALGTFVPVPFAGTILGGILGDIVGGALYDSLVGSKPEAKAQGGQVTRGGRKVSGSAKRSVRRVRTRPSKIKPQKTIPGKDVGGRKEIEKLFPSPTDTRQKNPLGVLETTSKNLKEIPLLGGIMGASVDLTMGQKPDASVFKKIGYGFGALVQNAIDAETSNTIGNIQKELVALAGGGAVPRTLSTGQSIGMQIGERLGKTLEAMMNSKVTETLQSIRQQFGKKGFISGTGGDGDGGGGDDEGDGSGGGMFSGKAADIPPEGKALLDAIAGSESGGYNSRYPSKTFDNGWIDHPRISETILSGPNKGKTSDAAGRYQFLSSTWDDYKPAKQFTPENQDIAAYRLAVAAYGYGESGLVKDLKKDPLKVANKLSGTWTSLPGGMEPNNATNGFLARYKAKVKKYESQGGPSLSAKGVKKFSRSDITSFFRQQESFRSKPHEGMDIAAPQGTPISFGMGGTVLGVWRTNSGTRDANGGYGTYMDVKFSDGRIARIAHLSNIPSTINKGTTFGANQIIAYSGGQEGAPGSGRSGGPHIHLEQLSKPMGSEETTKGKSDPLKGGLFDLIQRGGTKLSLAPSTTSNLASVLNQKTSYEIAGGPTIMLQKVIIEKPVPMPMSSGGPTGFIDNSRTSSSIASLAIG